MHTKITDFFVSTPKMMPTTWQSGKPVLNK